TRNSASSAGSSRRTSSSTCTALPSSTAISRVQAASTTFTISGSRPKSGRLRGRPRNPLDLLDESPGSEPQLGRAQSLVRLRDLIHLADKLARELERDHLARLR